MSSTLSTLEVLQKARDLISDPKRWTKEAYARDENGIKLFGPSNALLPSYAVCFCSIGAIAKVSEVSVYRAEHCPAYEILESEMEGEVDEFNDTHDHAAVLQAFDAAISKATAEGETA